MGNTTPNIGIFIPVGGESNYEQSYAAGMINIDQHDHSGGPNKGLPIGGAGIADFSITYNKFNANVADITTGIGVSVVNPNQLQILGILRSIFQIAFGTDGFLAKSGVTANARTLTGTANQIAITNGQGIAGNPVFSLAPIVKNSTQPCFIAGANTQNNVTGDGTEYTVLFANETVDQGNNFDPGTSIFTAPVAGNYLIITRVNTSGMDSKTTTRLRIFKNGSIEHTLNRLDSYTAGTNEGTVRYTLIGSEMMSLAANDQVKIGIRVDQVSNNKVVSVIGASFSGILLC